MNSTQHIDAALRSLDAADHHDNVSTSRRAHTDLERILTSTTTLQTTPRRIQSLKRTRRVALVGAAAAAATVAALLMPSLTGGDQAFASWTASPSVVSGSDERAAANDCRNSNEDVGGGQYADALAASETAIAERRGAWTTVVLTGADGFSAMCITDDTPSFFGSGMIGSIGTTSDYTAIGPRDLAATSLGTGTMSAGSISLAGGHAGADVVGVVYESPTVGDVTATVSKGHFALWLPGEELIDAHNGLDVTVAYRDGTTDLQRLHL